MGSVCFTVHFPTPERFYPTEAIYSSVCGYYCRSFYFISLLGTIYCSEIALDILHLRRIPVLLLATIYHPN